MIIIYVNEHKSNKHFSTIQSKEKLNSVSGIGFGMIYLPAIVMVGHWFDKKRAFATGLAVCGTGIGTFIFAPVCTRLIHEYEWRGAHLILAGVVLNCAACGAIFRPTDKCKPRR